tara:strand:+ start:834 stop:1052 length:219 start_codon:yes stop_codon:yes gene_type:complete
MYKNKNKVEPVKYDKKGKIGLKKNKGKRFLKIPIATKQKTKNACFKALDTDESRKLIKEEKKLDIEKIFNKN